MLISIHASHHHTLPHIIIYTPTVLYLPVVLHNHSGLIQSLRGEQDIPGICDHEEVLGAPHECALVPSRLFDVYVEGQLSRHPGFLLIEESLISIHTSSQM